MKTLESLKTSLLADSKTRAEYEALADEFKLARELIVQEVRARSACRSSSLHTRSSRTTGGSRKM